MRDLVKEFGYTAHIRARGEEAQAIKREAGFKARRWVVERTHSWMNRFRRILTRWEKKAANYLALLHLVLASSRFVAPGYSDRLLGINGSGSERNMPDFRSIS